jgi:hypothetical protein
MSTRRFGVWFLLAQSLGGAAWWIVLLGWPQTRAAFMASGAPDTTLLAFGFADAVFFVGASGVCAYGLWAGQRWAWALLCLHAGASGYAALYCWTLVGLTGGDGLSGAILMSPSLVVPGFLVWRLRPRE